MEYPSMEAGTAGTGSTHHFAFAVGSAEELEAWRDYLRSRGVQCTDVFERGGLRSIYVRDPDGHVVEIARPRRERGAAGPKAPPAPAAWTFRRSRAQRAGRAVSLRAGVPEPVCGAQLARQRAGAGARSCEPIVFVLATSGRSAGTAGSACCPSGAGS